MILLLGCRPKNIQKVTVKRSLKKKYSPSSKKESTRVKEKSRWNHLFRK